MTNSTLIPGVTTFYPSKIIHILIYPFLTGFLLDLPWINQTIVAIAFVLATLLVGDFVEALVALWQATAISAAIFLLIENFNDTSTSPSVAALFIPVMWLLILIFRHFYPNLNQISITDKFSVDLVAVIILFIFVFVVPRGFGENFGFLSAEDNEGWLRTVDDIAATDTLSLKSGFDSQTVQYFIKYVLNGFSHVDFKGFSARDYASPEALRIVSNAWIFVFASSLLFVLSTSFRFLKRAHSNVGNTLLLGAVGVQSVLFFRMSQDVGHFSQHLLNCVILIFVLQIVDFTLETRWIVKILLGLSCFVFALGVVGSYNPWLPVSLGCFFIVINSSSKKSLVRVLFNSRYLLLFFFFSLAVFPFVLKAGLSRVTGLDDGGGVRQIPQEGVWIASGICLLLFIRIFQTRFQRNSLADNKTGMNQRFAIKLPLICSSAALSLGILFGFGTNQMITLSFVCIIALLFSSTAVATVHQNFTNLTKTPEFDGVFLLAFASFLYTLVIYFMSRFVGPVYEPRYAAFKSMLTVFGQFSWLLLILVCANRNESNRPLVRFRTSTIVVCFLIVSGTSPLLKHEMIQTNWWHQPALEAINAKPNAVIVCVNPDWRIPDYGVYTCNRFLQTLTKFEYPAAGFRYLAWYQPDEFEKLSKWFLGQPGRARNFNSKTEVVVISRGELNLESMSVFNPVAPNMIEFKGSNE